MENLEDTSVINWMKEQNEYTHKILNQFPINEELYNRMHEIANLSQAIIGSVSHRAGRFFFIKILQEDEIGKLYYREGLDGEDILLIAPDQFKPEGAASASINYYEPSHDGKLVAFGISVDGSEDAILRIIDVDHKRLYDEEIDRAMIGNPVWLPDNQSFFMNRLQDPGADPDPGKFYLDSEAYMHIVDTDPDEDRLLLSRKSCPDLGFIPSDFPIIFECDAEHDIMMAAAVHGVQKELTLFLAPLSARNKQKINWEKICDTDQKVTDCDLLDGNLFYITYKDAPKYKLCKVPLKDPDFNNQHIILPEEEAVLEYFSIASDAIYTQSMLAGLGIIKRIPHGQTDQILKIDLPVQGNISFVDNDKEKEGILFSLTS